MGGRKEEGWRPCRFGFDGTLETGRGRGGSVVLGDGEGLLALLEVRRAFASTATSEKGLPSSTRSKMEAM
jgi:hypothetical protein